MNHISNLKLRSLGWILLLNTFLLAQSDTGRVQGTISDIRGAAISNATVTATNTATNKVYAANTNDTGYFSIPAVQRGPYKVEIKSPGFKTATQEFTLEISEAKTVNAALEPGSVSESVDVTAAATVLDTSTSATGDVIQGRQITELPLNGRNFTQLALFTPGVTRGQYGDNASGENNNVETFRNGETGGAALSVHGLRPQANNFILDGVDNNEAMVNSINFFPPAEAIQEFRVTTSVAPAEFGRAGGAIVHTSLKSGTNQMHGSAFWFHRNSVLDANNAYFGTPDRKTGKVAKLPFKRNQFGGTLGLPIWKDKLFIFGDYNAMRQDHPNNPEFPSVPTLKMRNGDFSELLGTGLTQKPASFTGCNVTEVNGAIYDPLTCAPFSGNGIPPSRINAAGRNYLNAFPMPNLPGVQNNFATVRRDIRQFNDFDIRMDYNPTTRDQFFARYSYGEDTFSFTSRLVVLPSGFGSGTNVQHPRGLAAGYTRTFGNSMVNDFRFGYSRPYYAYLNPFNNTPLSANLGIVNANRSPLLGGGALIGGNNGQLEFTGDGGPYIVPQKSKQFEDTVSWAQGNHTFRFGANVIKRYVDFFRGSNAKGNFALSNGDFTGYDTSELLAGFVDSYSIAVTNKIRTRSWETGYFAQDDWKVSSRLTLNLGLRYDLYINPYEENNQWSNFDIVTGTLKRAGVNGNSRSLVATDTRNFAPRIGFAYDLYGRGKSVLRGGYGIFYFLDRGGVGNQLSGNPDWSGAVTLNASDGNRVTLSGQGPLRNNDNSLATQPLPLPTTSTVNDAFPTKSTVIERLPNDKSSSIQQWNLQLSQELGNNTVFNLGYVGTKSDHLITWFKYNNPELSPNLTVFAGRSLTVNVGAASGTSRYNGLQLHLKRYMTNGLQYNLAYSWSHTLDNSNGAFSATGGGSRIFVDPVRGGLLKFNQGNSDTDQRHAFSFSTMYELPLGRRKRWGANWNGVVNSVLGGWQFNGIVSLGTGTPFDITISGERPDILAPVSLGSLAVTRNQRQWISAGPNTFAKAPQDANNAYLRPGTLGRNAFHGPGYRTLDASLIKKIDITERLKATLRVEGFNILNTPQFLNPQSDLGGINSAGLPSNANFGLINGTRQFSERQIQLAMRFQF